MTQIKYPILGLDFGTVRMGLAIAKFSLVEPYQILNMSDQIFDQIALICQKENIQTIIIGLSEGEMAEKTKNFGQKLSRQINLPIIFSDETLSSHDSLIKLHQIGKKTKYIDQYAACEMLQLYLDTIGTDYVV